MGSPRLRHEPDRQQVLQQPPGAFHAQRPLLCPRASRAAARRRCATRSSSPIAPPPAQRRHVADQLRPRIRKLSEFMDEAEPDLLAYMSFPTAHRPKLHSTDEMDRRFRWLLCYSPPARATSWRRAVRRLRAPPGRLFMPCRIEALAHRVPRTACLPVSTKLLVAASACSANDPSLISKFPDVVGVGGAAPIALLLRQPGLEFHGARLVGDQCQAGPRGSPRPWSASASTAPPACGPARPPRSGVRAWRGCVRRTRATALAPWRPPRPPRPASRGHGYARPC